MYRIAVAGNPNSGKTCLFNNLTGARQQVGNYPGVTVELVTGETTFEEEKFQLIDLPGTYSLTAYSQEEIVARNYIVEESPDVIINVVDASNLERNLYLTTQLLELRVPVVIALNMVDIAEKKGHSIDADLLAGILGIQVAPTIANKHKGIKELKQACLKTIHEKIMPRPVTYSHEIRLALPALEKAVTGNIELCGNFPPRWIAIKLLEDDEVILKKLRVNPERETINHALQTAKHKIHAHSNEESSTAVVEARYGFASGAAREVTKLSEVTKKMLTDNIDRIVCNRFLGPLILCLIVYLLFMFVFQVSDGVEWLPLFNGEWTTPTGLMGIIFDGIALIGRKYIQIPWLQSLVCDGIIGGVGGVMSFVPLLFFMFLGIAALEDSGYIARVAFIMDRVLRTFGLQGKSILAMIVSGGLGAGGCAVPGVMATRTLREDKDRLATILVAPFMNCGAKMPVYAMLIAAFFSHSQGAMMFLLWLLSWCFALGSAWLIRKVIIKGEQTPFVMELPFYHLPTINGVLIDTWRRTYMFIKKAATIILAVNIIMWALMYYPRYNAAPTEKAIAAAAGQLQQQAKSSKFAPALSGDELLKTEKFSFTPEDLTKKNLRGIDKLRVEFILDKNLPKHVNEKVFIAFKQYREKKELLEKQLAENQLKHSFAGRAGRFLIPVSELAGFGWRENIALIGGLAAKEVVVGTLGTAYSMGQSSTDRPEPLSQVLSSRPDWNPLRAFVLLVFVMAYAPCIVTLAAIKKETGKWRWAAFSAVYSTLVAFIAATVIYQIGSLF